jgi:hypothetical protein
MANGDNWLSPRSPGPHAAGGPTDSFDATFELTVLGVVRSQAHVSVSFFPDLVTTPRAQVLHGPQPRKGLGPTRVSMVKQMFSTPLPQGVGRPSVVPGL